MTLIDMPNKEKDAGPRDTSVQISWTTNAGTTYTVMYSDVWPPVWAGALAFAQTGPSYTDNTLGAVGAVSERYYAVVEEQSGTFVTAVNSVGVNLLQSCNGTYGLFGVSLDTYDSTLQDVIGYQCTGGLGPATADTIDLWGGSSYINTMLVDTGGAWPSFDGVWYDMNAGAASGASLGLGDGFWLTTHTGVENIYIEGEVPTTPWMPAIPAAGGQALLGHPYPMSIPMNLAGADNLGFLASGGVQGANESAADSIYLRDCGGAFRVQFLAPDGQWWTGGAPTMESLDPGEGFWVIRGTNAGGGFTWTLPMPY